MRVEIDETIDAAYLYLVPEIPDGAAVYTREIGEFLVDYDAQGRLLGVEIGWWSEYLRMYRGLFLPPEVRAELGDDAFRELAARPEFEGHTKRTHPGG